MEDIGSIYKWEKGINATWESVQEDEHGNIIAISSDKERSSKAKQSRITQSIRRGLIRYLVIALDCSSSSLEKDYRPSRIEVCRGAINTFIGNFFDQNPISQCCLAVTRDKVAESLTELSCNPRVHIDSLGNLMVMKGIASLQNTIITAMGILRHIPNYGHRELLVLYNSLSTCDPGDIYQTIAEAKAMKLRVNIICLSAELFICKKVAELTGGTFAVAIDSYHLAELLQQQTIPPPEIQANSTLVTDFIYMGFPKRVFQPHNCYGYDGKKVTVSTVAYQCPRCHTRTTDIPTQCCVCYLQLNSSSHIARSYHHLFPVPNYLEFQVRGVTSQLDILANKVDTLEDISHLHESNTSREASHTDNADNMDVESEAVKTEEITIPNKTRCFGCMVSFASHLLTTDSLIMQCGACKNYFCVECDLFVHDSLHNCPGCG